MLERSTAHVSMRSACSWPCNTPLHLPHRHCAAQETKEVVQQHAAAVKACDKLRNQIAVGR